MEGKKASIIQKMSDLNLNNSVPSSQAQSDPTCIVCFRDARFFSVGACDHGICFECSARMRVLAPSQNECAICRQELEHVVFTKKRTLYREVKGKLRMFVFVPAYNIYIEDAEVEEIFNSLLDARCHFCDENTVYKDFAGLKRHVQRIHDLHACDLCIEHIKLFPSERRFYVRSDLALHKRKGDKEDSSHKGHPLCKWCNRRYFDDDSLFKHLRKDHYFCHFCDSDGFNHFYDTYDQLRIHFRCDHYLCEEEHCKDEKFTSVFRTEIDLKAHLASVHSRLLGKQGLRQARQLDVDFSQRRREGDGGRQMKHSERRIGPHVRNADFRGSWEELGQAEDTRLGSVGATSRVLTEAVPIDLHSANDFPTLLGNQMWSNSAAATTSLQRAGLQNESPSGQSSTTFGSHVKPKKTELNQSVGNGTGATSQSRNFKPSWNSKVSGSSKMDEEFPALFPGETTYSATNQVQGKNRTFKSITQSTPVVPRVLKTAKFPVDQIVPSSEDFPSLAGPSVVRMTKLPPRTQNSRNSREYQGKRSMAPSRY